MIKFFFLISFFHISFQKCLISSNSDPNLCLVCDESTYNTNFLFSKSFEFCEKKKINFNYSKIVFIRSDRKNNQGNGSLENPYDNIIEAFFSENLNIIKETDYESNITIIFKLLKGVHYVIDYDINSTILNLFRRTFIDIIIEPYFCDNPLICLTNNEKLIINWKTKKPILFITKSIIINSITFEFIDLNDKNPCLNELKICCDNSCFYNENIKYSIEKQNFYSNPIGFINLEPIFEGNILLKPKIIIKNVDLLNFKTNTNSITYYSFIIYDDFPVDIIVENCKFINNFFIFGFIYKRNFYNEIYSKLILKENLLKKYIDEKLKTNITFLYSEISNYLINDKIIFDSKETHLKLCLFGLYNFEGTLNFSFNKIINSKFNEKNIFNLMNNLELLYILNIESNLFYQSEFSWMSFEDNFLNNNEIALKIVNNSFDRSNISNLLTATYVTNVIISGVFENFNFVSQYFVQSIFSNISIDKSIFQNLNNDNILLYLVDFKSPNIKITGDVFSNFIKTKYESNDSFTFNNSVIKNSNLLLIKTYNYAYSINIVNSKFEDLNFQNAIDPFIRFTPEKEFFLKNVTFKNFKSFSSLIFVEYFLRFSLDSLILENIEVYYSDIVLFRSQTTNHINYNNNLNNSIFKNIYLYQDPNSLSKYGVFDLDCRNTGWGANINITNLYVENVEFNKIVGIPTLMRLNIVIHYSINITFINITGCTTIFQNTKTTTGLLYLYNVSVITSNNIFRIVDTNNIYIKSVYIYNCTFKFGFIRDRNAIYIFSTDLFIMENVIMIGGGLGGSFLFFQITKLSDCKITNIYMKNNELSTYGFITMGTKNNLNNWNLNITENLIQYKFGISNSYFENSYNGTAILGLQGSEIYVCNSTFKNVSAIEGGVLNMGNKGKFLLYNSIILNSCSSNSGGAFYLESSLLFLFKVNIVYSQSLQSGGIGYLRDSIFIVKNCYFNLILAKEKGGSFSIQNTESYILNSSFINCSSEQFGGHIYVNYGTLLVNNSIFEEGSSKDFAGSFFIDNTNCLILNSIFLKNNADLAILFIFGNNLIECMFINNTFQSNSISSSGLIQDSDMNINFINCNFFDNIVEKGLLFEIYGFTYQITANIENTLIKNNFAKDGFILSEESKIIFNKTIISENNFSSDYISIMKVTIIIMDNNVIIKQTNNTKLNLINYLISAKNCFINITNSSFEMSNSLGLLNCLNCENIILFSINLKTSKNLFGAGFLLFNSDLYGNLIFFQNSYAQEGGAIYSEDSNIILNNSYFINNFAKKIGSDIEIIQKLNLKKLILENCFFYNSSLISIFSSYIHTVNIKFSFFQGCKTYNSNNCQALNFENCKEISINSSNFYNFSDFSAISIQNNLNEKNEILINNSNFKYGNSILGGLLYISGNNLINVLNSNFIEGKALKGGSIYFDCTIFNNCSIIIENSTFINNTANISGGSIQSKTIKITENKNIFKRNYAETGSNINFYPSKFLILISQNQTELEEFTFSFLKNSSKEITKDKLLSHITKNIEIVEENINLIPGYIYSIFIFILDEKYTLQTTESNNQLLISIPHSNKKNNTNLLNNLATSIKGTVFFKDFLISSPLNETLNLIFFYNANNSIDSFSKSISIKIQNCKRGDSYEDYQCLPCPNKKYSLDIISSENSCIDCPSNGYCPGSDLIIPYDNFWRKDENTTKLSRCLSELSCLYSNNINFNNTYKCEIGYKGNLCASCEEGYGKRGNNCALCDDNQGVFLFIFFLGLFIILSYCDWQERINSGKTHVDHISLLLTKILQNHMSSFVIVGSLSTDWTGFSLQIFIFFTSYFSTSPSSIYSFDCFLKQSEYNLLFSTILIVGLLPFFLAFIMLFFKFLVNLIFMSLKKMKNEYFNEYINNHKKFKWILSEFLKHLTVIFFNCFAQSIAKFLKIFGCIQIDDSEIKYVRNYPFLICYGDSHINIILITTLFLIIYCLAAPILLFILIRKNELKIQISLNNKTKHNSNVTETDISEKIEENIKFISNFVIRGYKNSFYYWELVILLRKFLILFLITWASDLDSLSIGGLAMLFYFSYLLMNENYHPFNVVNMNNLENFSLFTTICTISLVLLLNEDTIETESQYFFYFIIVLINCLFFLIWLKLFIKKSIETLKEKKISIGRNLIKTINVKKKKENIKIN